MKYKFFIYVISLLSWEPYCFAIPRTSTTRSQSVSPILLVVSYDGFRNEYLRRNVTPNLLKFRNEGLYTEHMLNVFPTKTFTNHFSISTGFYPEVHGVLANSLYDKVEGALGYSYKLFHYNDSIVPIWITNERAGGHSGCMMWPGSDFQYKQTGCTYTEKYNSSIPLTERVDTVMKWLIDPVKPANLIMFYSEQPDKLAHMVGPDSENITQMVASLDLVTKYIQDQLIIHGLEKRTTVIHLSDHGMAGVHKSNFINLTDFLTPFSYKFYGTSPVLQLVPAEGTTEDVYQALKKASLSNGNFDVYKSEELPKRWHANNPRRFGPIIAIAKMNYAFQDMWPYINKTNEANEFGVHGYDNEEELMYPIFMAKGPALKSGGQPVEPFETVDLYQLFTKIIDIKDSSPRDGSADRIINLLAAEPKGDDASTIIIVLVSVGAILAVIIFVIKFRKKKHFYTPT